jgi:phosphate transport system substrate-binding protein
VTNGKGTIGYADASQAGDLGTAAVKVGDEFVEYSPEAAAAVLDASKPVEGRGDADLALEIDRKVDAKGVYPVVLVSYQMACQQYDDAAKAELVKAWLSYVASSDGQQTAGEDAGSAPLSDSIGQKVKSAVDTITAS